MKRFKFLYAFLFIVVIAVIVVLMLKPGVASYVEIKACVLYFGEEDGWQEAYSQLRQSHMASMTVEAVKYSEGREGLYEYDIIYPDESIMKILSAGEFLVDYTKKGGNLFLTNGFLSYFDKDFLGAEEIVKISCPDEIIFPKEEQKYSEIQELINDYNSLYKEYKDYSDLKNKDYGFGIVPNNAVSIADNSDGICLYGFNSVEEGTIFFANRLLPNPFHINSTDFKRSNEEQTYYVNTDTTANQLIRSKFAALISRKIHGHAIERVFGPYGTPAAAWQLHYEEITGIENDSAILFSELCKKYNQIPSFTLIRNSYKWFSRYETITYLLAEDGEYNIDFNEGAYGSGRHIVENNKILKITEFEDRGSYFEDYPQYDEYAYPAMSGSNNDMISGSSDGHMYYYKGISTNDNDEWRTEFVEILTDSSDKPVRVDGYSAPDLMHVDDDDILDLISGAADGNIYWFKGEEGFKFSEQGILIDTNGEMTNSMPTVGRIYDTEVILAGSKEGVIKCYTKSENSFSEIDINIEMEGFSAPCIYSDHIFIGTNDGYIKKYKIEDGFVFSPKGYVEGREKNYKGNNRLKFGNNAVPRFYDVNYDGQPDLVVGSIEYGLAIPIDSPYFQFREKLQEQVDYIKNNDFYLGLHFYTNEYASKEREEAEIRLQKESFKSYGIDVEGIGANQHTWFISSENDTFRTQHEAGVLWNSGFRSINAPVSPEASTETSLSGMYFMNYGNRDMLVFNTIPFFGSYPETAELSAKYNLPVSFYYHCDFAYESPENSENNIKAVDGFLKNNGYNMIREDQLVKAAAASLNTIAEVEKTQLGFTIVPRTLKTDFPLYDKKYQDSVGYKISFADDTSAELKTVSADVYNYDFENNCIYVGSGGKISVKNLKRSYGSSISSVNLPAKISKNSIKFLDGGYMQVIINGTGVTVKSKGWDVRSIDDKTIISKFGRAENLKLSY